MFSRCLKWLIAASLVIVMIECGHVDRKVDTLLVSISPRYTSILLRPQTDTLHFPLDEDAFNEIKSFNYFVHGEQDFLSFYDANSQSVLIYELMSCRLFTRLFLKKVFPKKQFYKVSVFTKNLDSIFITNRGKIYLINSEGTSLRSIGFFDRNDAMATLGNNLPAVAHHGKIYTGIHTYIDELSVSAIRRWKTLYGFDFSRTTRELHHPLPEVYRGRFYGDRFFDYSYCYNDRGRFVFSFALDTCIYETDLTGVNYAYFAKSRFQAGSIPSVEKELLSIDGQAYREYLLRDSYGAIYYDRYHKRYLRLARHKLTEKDYAAGVKKKEESVIVFNDRFGIIGEFMLANEFSFHSLFFTHDGRIYARVKARDEYALHFVRLAYENADAAGSTSKTSNQ